MIKLIIQTYRDLSKLEKRFIIIVSLAVLLISFLPFLYATVLAKNSGRFYSGFLVINGYDTMVYLSQIEEASQGKFLTSNLFTSEQPALKYFSPLWLALGQFSKLTNISPLATFQLSRLVFGFIFFWGLYLFLSRFIKPVKWRFLAWLILIFGSGLGLATLSRNVFLDFNSQYYLGIDLTVPEANIFNSLFHSPLFILSQICLLLIFWWLIERLICSGWPETIASGLLILLLGLIHPFDLLTVVAVSGFYFLIEFLNKRGVKFKQWLKLGALFCFSLMPLAYFYYLKISSPIFLSWHQQNICLSYGIYNYLIGYGLIFIGFLIGVYPALKSFNKYWRWLAVWAIVGWLLVYWPFQYQRRMLNGLHLPMSLVAILGLMIAWQFLGRKIKISPLVKKTILALFLTAIFSTNVFLAALELVNLNFSGERYFMKPEARQAFKWLKSQTDFKDNILSASPSGALIAAYSGRHIYLGHSIQTVNFDNKAEMVKWFYGINNDDKLKASWLTQEGITYVFYSQAERSLGHFDPFKKPYLKAVWQKGESAIFKVLPKE